LYFEHFISAFTVVSSKDGSSLQKSYIYVDMCRYTYTVSWNAFCIFMQYFGIKNILNSYTRLKTEIKEMHHITLTLKHH